MNDTETGLGSPRFPCYMELYRKTSNALLIKGGVRHLIQVLVPRLVYKTNIN